MDQGHVLVVDGDGALVRRLKLALEQRGYRVTTAASGREALDRAVVDEPQVVLLELQLPDLDGLDVAAHLRRRSRASILVVTADADEDRMVQALDGPADDYVTKPFATRVLLARVGVAIRHQHQVVGATADDRVVTFGSLRIDPGAHVAAAGDTELALAAREFALVLLLARNQGRVVAHRAILDAIWGPTVGIDTLRTHVHQVRRKLEAVPGAPRLVAQVRVGYRLALP